MADESGGWDRLEDAIDFVDVELMCVEVAATPFKQFGVTLMLRVCDGLREFSVAHGSPTCFGRTTLSALDEPRIGDTRVWQE